MLRAQRWNIQDTDSLPVWAQADALILERRVILTAFSFTLIIEVYGNWLLHFRNTVNVDFVQNLCSRVSAVKETGIVQILPLIVEFNIKKFEVFDYSVQNVCACG